MPKLTCDELSIPSRLRRNNKPVVNTFNDDEEVLYRWFDPSKVESESNGRISATTIKQAFTPLSELSNNRSSMSLYSTDVLYSISKLPHRDGFGVIKAKVTDINERTFDFDEGSKNNGNKKLLLSFKLKHDPEDCMYPHTIILIYKEGIELKGEIKGNLLKTAIRDQIGKLFKVCHPPDPTFKLELEQIPVNISESGINAENSTKTSRFLNWIFSFFPSKNKS